MDTNLVKELDATKGMQLVCEMIKTSYIAEKVASLKGGNAKSHLSIISAGVTQSIRNGKPYYFTNQDVDTLQLVIKEIGMQLMQTELLSIEQAQEQHPLCYGTTYVEKFKILRKIIVLPYLFEKLMGRTIRWQKMHVSDKASQYYNHFTDDEVVQINNGIRTIALNLCSIKLNYIADKEG